MYIDSMAGWKIDASFLQSQINSMSLKFVELAMEKNEDMQILLLLLEFKN